MQIYSSFRYQLFSHKKDLLVYYLILVGMQVLAYLVSIPLTLVSAGNGGLVITSSSGISAISCIFLLVAGICSFRESFSMALQNGVSRRNLFFGRLCASAALCLIMAMIDEASTLLLRLAGLLPGVQTESFSLLETVFSSALSGLSPVLVAFAAVPFSFCLLLAFGALGYFISTLFYRLNKLGKLLIGIGSALLLLVGLPGVFELYDHYPQWPLWPVLGKALFSFFHLAFGAPWNAGVSCLILFGVFSLFTWLLMRRAELKK
ncbi:hypothetical protein [Neglectibacter caecimuris]|uniref:hypothetical protein n=1 Tax=Neglectibacter caecimuris TaxID=3093658 RepID=UPI002AC96B67|nr:hypothetical protein [Neglectibacter sp. M00184]